MVEWYAGDVEVVTNSEAVAGGDAGQLCPVWCFHSVCLVQGLSDQPLGAEFPLLMDHLLTNYWRDLTVMGEPVCHCHRGGRVVSDAGFLSVEVVVLVWVEEFCVGEIGSMGYRREENGDSVTLGVQSHQP